MKGMIFSEFLEHTREKFGLEVMDRTITKSENTNDSYVSIGQYPPEEMLNLVGSLSRISDVPVDDLLESFGQYLFKRFSELYPDLVNKYENLFHLLLHLDSEIHIEVYKLIDGASPPNFRFTHTDQQSGALVYTSPLRLNSLVIGLVKGAADYFNTTVQVVKDEEQASPEEVRFTVRIIQ